MFEIPRQQNDEKKEPEIVQFKATQKLIDPNQENLTKVESKETESHFEKLKESANILFKEKKYNEAIKAYSKILQISGLSSENQATIYSNRSASYVMLEDKNSSEMAKADAEKAIKLCPSWWKGYFRLGRVFVSQDEWKNAEENFTRALSLNPESIGEMTQEKKPKPPSPLDYDQYGKSVEKAAKNGSITAQQHMKIWEYLSAANEAFKKNDSAELVKSFAKAIRLNPQIVEISEKRLSTHPNELETIICYVKKILQQSGMPKNFLNIFKKYPDDECLAEMACIIYLIIENFKDALNHIKVVLKRHPNSLRLIYWHARTLCSQEPRTEECIKALDDFLTVAPEDYPNVPACYYYKAEYYCRKKDYQKFVESFEAGLAAEKKQLPCFLPYQFEDPPGLTFYLDQIKSDPKRKSLIIQQRDYFAQNGTPIYSFSKPACTPNPPNWSLPSLKKITFTDMNPTKEAIFNDCILEGKIIDWPIVSVVNNVIHTLFEDKNGDINRLTIYNWPKTDNRKYDINKAMEVFRPNVFASIINPYHRILKDGQVTICVEGLEYIMFSK
uniref:Tetratricopeptide repeat protein n=1 Tax=Panagrolaimus davidi TaxID=227884 RepID=A0A914PK10_9BILA